MFKFTDSLSAEAREWGEGYVQYQIMEALQLTEACDRDEVIESMESFYSEMTFRDLTQEALHEGFISSLDEVYNG